MGGPLHPSWHDFVLFFFIFANFFAGSATYEFLISRDLSTRLIGLVFPCLTPEKMKEPPKGAVFRPLLDVAKKGFSIAEFG